MRKRYGNGIKTFLIIAETLFVILGALCVGMVSNNAVINVESRGTVSHYYISPFSKSAAFIDSDVFNDMLYDDLNDAVRYCVIRDQFETKGVFDKKKEIDIEQYARHFEELPVTDTSVRYYLGDLIKWAQADISIQEFPYSEVEQMIAECHGQELLLEEGVAETSEETAEWVQVPVERYLPVDGRSLLAHVESVEELNEMMWYLTDTLDMLRENYRNYKEYQNYYGSAEHNFAYCIVRENDKNTAIYSNREMKGKTVQEITDSFCAMGRYVCFAPASFSYETNTSIREESVRGIWNAFNYAYPDNTRIWVGVDTQFPYMDAYAKARDAYQVAAPGYLLVLAGMICGLLALGLLIWLTMLSGRKPDREEVCLIWFDRWVNEIAGFIALIACSAVILVSAAAVTQVFYYMDTQPVERFTVLVLCVLISNLVILFFYLSLVRRIKADYFWKNFLVCKLFQKCHSFLVGIYDDSRNVVRTWVPYLAFLLANAMLVSIGGRMPHKDHWSFLLLLIVDFIVGGLCYRDSKVKGKILEGIKNIRGGNLDYQIDVKGMHGDNKILAEAVNSIGNGIRDAVETSMRDERMKADLITNVSHDIKTPLTSIVNYVGLIKREPIENEKIKGYLEVLDSKSQRLKQLTEDLVEVSRISSGNITLQCDKLNFTELMNQTVGEFVEKFEERGLRIITDIDEGPLLIYADSRRVWRVMENLFNNAFKYAMEKTRVYVEAKSFTDAEGVRKVRMSLKNISAQPLNMNVEDLTERFIRGDVARSTEGSGLGLSIAKNLTELQKGKFQIFSDGDLFKAVVIFDIIE